MNEPQKVHVGERVQRLKGEQEPMIISVSAHKGGVGKTTTSVNLSVGLASLGKKALLIDFDPQGHSSIGLDHEIEYSVPNMADVLGDQNLPLREVLIPIHDHLDLAPANLRLAKVGETLYASLRKEEKLKKALRSVSGSYDFILIDCPPSLGILTANAILAADFIIIPCQVSPRSTDGLNDLLDIARLLKDVERGEFEHYLVLMTMVDLRNKATNEAIFSHIKERGYKTFDTAIHMSTAHVQSQIMRQTIFDYDPRGRGAEDYLSLAREVLKL